MNDHQVDDLRFFAADQDFSIVWRDLPHWTQAGTIAFITWRTMDSMPKHVLQDWIDERDAILCQHCIDPHGDWKRIISALPAIERRRVRWGIFSAWDRRLDNCEGACVLADPEMSKIVLESLLHFDEVRYVLTDAVVMPNHVHCLAAFFREESILDQCTSWKHFTAREINRRLVQRAMQCRPKDLGGDGPLRRESRPLWQPDQFDHLVRSLRQFEFYRRYLRDNPFLAGLREGMWRHYSRAL